MADNQAEAPAIEAPAIKVFPKKNSRSYYLYSEGQVNPRSKDEEKLSRKLMCKYQHNHKRSKTLRRVVRLLFDLVRSEQDNKAKYSSSLIASEGA